MKNVSIMRGIPGSGKSTYVRRCIDRLNHNEILLSGEDPNADFVICSADDYHFDPTDGKYRFHSANIKNAHNACLKKFLHTLMGVQDEGSDKYVHSIFVDNTNLTVWEISPYYRLAEMYGWNPQIVNVLCDLDKAISRGVHNVPPEKMWQMYQTMMTEKLPSHWQQTILIG
jgi:hypothetical protein